MLLWLLIACPKGPTTDDPSDTDCPPVTWHADVDADGYGSPSDTTLACDAPPGHFPTGDDCDDLDSAVYPGAPELCDGVARTATAPLMTD